MRFPSGGSPSVSEKLTRVIFESVESEFGPSLAERREALRAQFGDAPIPNSIVEAALDRYAADDPFFRGLMIQDLTETRGAEMLPRIEQLLQSEDLDLAGWGALALLTIADPRAFREIERLHEQHLGKDEKGKFSIGWFVTELIEQHSPDALALAERLESNAIRFHAGEKK